MFEELSKEYLSQSNYCTYAPVFLVFRSLSKPDHFPRVFLLESEAQKYAQSNKGEVTCASIPTGSYLLKVLQTVIDKSYNEEQYRNILGH